MAQNQPVDVTQLLKDAAANAKAAKAARDAAKAAADKLKASNEAERRIKTVAQQKNQYAEGLQSALDDDLVKIKMLVRDITDAGGKATTAQTRDLKFFSQRYNSTLAAQSKTYAEVKDLSAGKYDVDTTGKLVAKKSPTGTSKDSDGDGIPDNLDNLPNVSNPDQKTGFGTTAAAGVQTQGMGTITPENKVTGGTAGSTAGGTVGGNTGGKVTGGTTGGTTGGNAGKAAGSTSGGTVKLTTEQQSALGTYGSKYLLDYFKTAENGKYKYIYDKLITFATQNADFNMQVAPWLRDQTWYKDVNQRTMSVVGAAELANGLKLDTATKEKYRDKILGKVLDPAEMSNELRLKAISEYQLDTTKPDVARLMRAGQDFQTAASDYIDTYKKTLELSNAQFQISDANFQTLFKSSTSLGDFDKKVKHTPQYLSLPKVQQAIASNVIMVKQKYRNYGLTLTGEAAQNLGQNAYLGDTSTEAIDENLRQEAIKLFPAFKDRILNGESPLSIASPYIGAVQRILEIPEGALDLEDPTIRKAMMGTTKTIGDKTSSEVTPLWQFEQDLYKDSRWQYTSNARQKLDGITLDIFSRFGVIG